MKWKQENLKILLIQLLTANSVALFSFEASTSKVFRSSTNVKGVSSKAGGFNGSLSGTRLSINCSGGSFSCNETGATLVDTVKPPVP